jgi:hypothetical protein
MLRSSPIILICALLAIVGPAAAQTRLRLSTIIPGSERVQLVYNGDFQFQGPLITNSHPLPAGWIRQADMFADPGINTVPGNSGVVALARVRTGGPICLYYRTVQLEPNTAYILSAYLWNMGDSANHVVTVIDLNDVPNEPQITLAHISAIAVSTPRTQARMSHCAFLATAWQARAQPQRMHPSVRSGTTWPLRRPQSLQRPPPAVRARTCDRSCELTVRPMGRSLFPQTPPQLSRLPPRQPTWMAGLPKWNSTPAPTNSARSRTVLTR